jgi:hypothetical protein
VIYFRNDWKFVFNNTRLKLIYELSTISTVLKNQYNTFVLSKISKE